MGLNNTVMLYDYQDKKQIYSLDSKLDSPPTSIQWMNPSASPLLLEGTQKGSVFIWSIPTLEKHKQPQIRSSFTAFPAFAKTLPGGRVFNTNLLLEWNQDSGLLAAAGSTQIVKIWDVETEKIQCERDTGMAVPAVAIKSVASREYYCCLSNGKLIGVDVRVKNVTSLFAAGIGENSRVVGMCPLGNSVMIGDFNGNMHVVDTRTFTEINCLPLVPYMSSLEAHSEMNALVATSLKSEIMLTNREGAHIQSIRVLDGFRALSLGKVLGSAMHPIDSAVACYNSNGIVYVYK